MIYKYTLHQDETRYIPWLKGVYLEYDYVIVSDGWVTVKKGYSWDGATPKIKLFGKWIGVPDGRKDQLKVATMWHDVLTQYGIGKKKDVDKLFLLDMLEVGWKFSILYYIAVRLFGWLRWKRN